MYSHPVESASKDIDALFRIPKSSLGRRKRLKDTTWKGLQNVKNGAHDGPFLVRRQQLQIVTLVFVVFIIVNNLIIGHDDDVKWQNTTRKFIDLFKEPLIIATRR